MKHPFKNIFTFCFLFTAMDSPLFAQNCTVLDPEIAGVYTGECKNGKASGHGKSIGKSTYEGNFKAGLPDGQGELTDELGNVFKGNFKKGEKNGEGISIIKNKQGLDSIVNGFWKKDAYLGLYENPYKIVSKSSTINVFISYQDPIPGNTSINLKFSGCLDCLTTQYNLSNAIIEVVFKNDSNQAQNKLFPPGGGHTADVYFCDYKNLIFPAAFTISINDKFVEIILNEPKQFIISMEFKPDNYKQK